MTDSKKMDSKEALTQEELLDILAERFHDHKERHPEITWNKVAEVLRSNQELLETVAAMEESGGEPDVVAPFLDKRMVFADCSAESPVGRRSLCYDETALAGRKKNPPKGSAEGMAQNIGITILNEEEYRCLQEKVAMDQKTSSWVLAPTSVRDLGGGLFGDLRYGRVFIYHNGADSYYNSRGFRGYVTIY